jgi:hypothetical protein
MNAKSLRERAAWLWIVSTTVALTACETSPVTPVFPAVPAPTFAIGDHWQYRIIDNLRRGLVSTLDAEVVAMNGTVATLRLVQENEYGRSESTSEVSNAGALVFGTLKPDATPRRFSMPVKLYDFPLEGNKTWRQVIDTISPETQLKAQILVYCTVHGQTTISAPAGSFETVYVYRILQLDDDQFWRSRTTRNDSAWYSKAVKGPVRELREASFYQYGGGVNSLVRTESTTSELVSFTPGGGRQ